VEYDLSKVMFRVHGQRAAHDSAALQDRMEILRIPGYTEKEKLEIAKRFLVSAREEATG
jgi:ATP-dependent Lon protease